MNDIDNKKIKLNIENNKIAESYQDYMNDITISDDFHKQLVDIPLTIANQKVHRGRLMKQFSHLAATICIVVVSLGTLGFFLSVVGGGGTDSDEAPIKINESSGSAPTQESNDITPEDNTACEDSDTSPLKPSIEGESTRQDNTTTFDLFCSTYSSTPYISQDAVAFEKDALRSEDELFALLPESLQGKLNRDSIQLKQINNITTLSCLYSSTNDTAGQLSISVHPIYTYEEPLLTSPSNVIEYSLSTIDERTLTTNIHQYGTTMLYPIFEASELTKDVIASRQYRSGNTISFSFGVYKDNYVITYVATGLTAEELEALLLN